MSDYVGWTDDRVAHLKAGWAAGHSCRTIANALGVSRNAVIGKVHRLGLPGRALRHKKVARSGMRPTYVRQQPRPKPKPSRRPSPLFDILANPPPHIDDVARFKFHALEPHHCRWPVNEPGAHEFGFCGCPRAPGLSYCPSHAARAYAAPVVTKRQPAGAFKLSPRLTIAREDA